MQYKKGNIRERILTAAREEFLKNGFEKASIRNITAAAKTSKSNIYNYFNDKNALFAAVVEPTLRGIKNGFDKLRAENPGHSAGNYSINAQKDVILRIMNFVFKHDQDIKLLLFCSSGSALSGFKDEVTRDLADVLFDWVAYAAPDKGISRFFIQTVAGFYVGAIEQMLSQGLSAEKMAENFETFLEFIYGGWKAIL